MDPINPYEASATLVDVSPGILPPRTFAGIFATGTRLYVSRFPALLGITLVVWGPAEVFQSYVEYFVFDPENVRATFRLAMLMEGLVGIIAVASVILVGAAAMKGEEIAWWRALGQGLAAWPRLFATRLVAGFLLSLSALCFVIPYLYFAPRFSLSDTATVLEGKAGPSAIRRSMRLTQQNYLVYLGLCALTIIPVIVVGIVVQLPLVLFPEINDWLLSASLTWLADLFTPWMTLVFVAAYFAVPGDSPDEERLEEVA